VDRDYPYGVEQADAQIRAVYDVGLEDWIFWHPGSRYEQIAGAFARQTTSRRRPFSPSPDFISWADLIDRQGAASARAAVVGAPNNGGER
jgi:hypothetical protein